MVGVIGVINRESLVGLSLVGFWVIGVVGITAVISVVGVWASSLAT